MTIQGDEKEYSRDERMWGGRGAKPSFRVKKSSFPVPIKTDVKYDTGQIEKNSLEVSLSVSRSINVERFHSSHIVVIVSWYFVCQFYSY